MITVTFDVYCDHKGCRANTKFVSSAVADEVKGLANRLESKGWAVRVASLSSGSRIKTFCPAHKNRPIEEM